jgi:hypothetical protein
MSGPAKWLFPGAALASVLSKKKKKKPAAQPVATPTRNAAAENARRFDELRRRRGAGANELTGGGAEARSPGGKVLLGA